MKIETELCPASAEECGVIRNRFRAEADIRERLKLQECGSFGIKTSGSLMTLMLHRDSDSMIYLTYAKHREDTFIDLTTLFTDGSCLTTSTSPTAGYAPKIEGHHLQIFKDAGLETCWQMHKEGIDYLHRQRSTESKRVEPDEFEAFLLDLYFQISSRFSLSKTLWNMILLKHRQYAKPVSRQA